MNYNLPITVTVGGTEYPVRWDYRAVLDICAALDDPELSQRDRAEVTLIIFYPDLKTMPPEDYEEALERFMWFLNCGELQAEGNPGPKLIDWEQDFPYIAAPVNRVLGREIREDTPIHWWTFIGAYYEIGDCTLAQIVRVRDRLARGKKLDKADREWYQRNRSLVDLKNKYTQADRDLEKKWLGK